MRQVTGIYPLIFTDILATEFQLGLRVRMSVIADQSFFVS